MLCAKKVYKIDNYIYLSNIKLHIVDSDIYDTIIEKYTNIDQFANDIKYSTIFKLQTLIEN